MRLIQIISVLIFATFATATAHADDSSEIAAVLAAADKLGKAFEATDKDAIASMMTPDQIAAAPVFGLAYGKAVTLDQRTPTLEGIQYTSRVEGDYTVSLLDDNAAIIQYEVNIDATYQGKKLPEHAFVTETWVKQDGQWLQRVYQETSLTGF